MHLISSYELTLFDNELRRDIFSADKAYQQQQCYLDNEAHYDDDGGAQAYYS